MSLPNRNIFPPHDDTSGRAADRRYGKELELSLATRKIPIAWPTITSDDATVLVKMCRTGRLWLYDLEKWIVEGKPLDIDVAKRKPLLQIAVETGFHSLIERMQRWRTPFHSIGLISWNYCWKTGRIFPPFLLPKFCLVGILESSASSWTTEPIPSRALHSQWHSVRTALRPLSNAGRRTPNLLLP